MVTAAQNPVVSKQSGSPDQRVAVGEMTRRSSGSRRVLAALGVVLAMLLGSVVAVTAPAGATTSFSVVDNFFVGEAPADVAMSADGSRVYVVNRYSNSVSVINTATNTVTATVSIGVGTEGVAVSPDGSRLYVINGSKVRAINTATNT